MEILLQNAPKLLVVLCVERYPKTQIGCIGLISNVLRGFFVLRLSEFLHPGQFIELQAAQQMAVNTSASMQ
jgi:hypothetical protein